MKPQCSRGISLMELVIALILLGLVVIGISHLELFCRYNFVSTDRKTKIINDAGYVMAHMSKQIGRAIGNAGDVAVHIDNPALAACTNNVRVWIDSDDSGIKTNTDQEVMYCYNSAAHTISYYSNYSTVASPSVHDYSNEVLVKDVVAFTASQSGINFFVNISTCWNASAPSGNDKSCGTVDNPLSSVQTRIPMLLVSF